MAVPVVVVVVAVGLLVAVARREAGLGVHLGVDVGRGGHILLERRVGGGLQVGGFDVGSAEEELLHLPGGRLEGVVLGAVVVGPGDVLLGGGGRGGDMLDALGVASVAGAHLGRLAGSDDGGANHGLEAVHGGVAHGVGAVVGVGHGVVGGGGVGLFA